MRDIFLCALTGLELSTSKIFSQDCAKVVRTHHLEASQISMHSHVDPREHNLPAAPAFSAC